MHISTFFFLSDTDSEDVNYYLSGRWTADIATILLTIVKTEIREKKSI